MDGQKKPVIRVRDVMNKEVVTIDGMATAKEAVEIMRQKKTPVILVNKRHPDDAWGIVATQDIIREVLLTDRSPEEVNVYELMTKPVITVDADMDIRYAARLLYRADIRRAPIEVNGEIVGVINLTSLVLEHDLF